MLTHVDMLIRIAVGALLGAAIGYERGQRGRPLGLRTHLLVALASATFMVCSSQFAFYQGYREGAQTLVEVDSSRIAASVVSGVGFIAGGSILRSGVHVQGLTTAAALWLVSAIGMCAGGGMFVEACWATALGLVALALVRRFEDKSEFPIRGTIVITQRERTADLCALLERRGMIVTSVEDTALSRPDGRVTVSFELKRAAKIGLVGVMHELEAQPATERVHLERMG